MTRRRWRTLGPAVAGLIRFAGASENAFGVHAAQCFQNRKTGECARFVRIVKSRVLLTFNSFL